MSNAKRKQNGKTNKSKTDNNNAKASTESQHAEKPKTLEDFDVSSLNEVERELVNEIKELFRVCFEIN